MKLRLTIGVVVLCLGATVLASATMLKGTVANATTGKSVAGDEIVLISLADGMNEVARTRSGAGGSFNFKLADTTASHLVRVVHQGVTYHALASPGASSVQVRVYDVAQKLDDVSVIVHTQRFQASGDTLQVSEVVTLRNASAPPRTLMNDRPFQLWVPPNARLDAGLAQSAGSNPLKFMPTLGERQGEYYFRFPLRPGETRFAVAYRVPYNGETVIQPKLPYPLERFAVVVPKSMGFQPKSAGQFKPAAIEAADNVQVTAEVKPGQDVSFRLSGMGMLAGIQGVPQQSSGGQEARPGGGLGAPTELPDPLHNYRWPILLALTLVLAAGGVLHSLKRSSARARDKRKATAVFSAAK